MSAQPPGAAAPCAISRILAPSCILDKVEYKIQKTFRTTWFFFKKISWAPFMYTGVHCCVGWRHTRFEMLLKFLAFCLWFPWFSLFSDIRFEMLSEIFSFLSLFFHGLLSFLIYCVYCVYYVYSSVRSKGERQGGIQNPKTFSTSCGLRSEKGG